MACPQKLVNLPCGKTGIGYLSQPLNCDSLTLRLMDGHQSNFPALTAGQHFYVVITKPCETCCATFRVTAVTDNILTISGLSDCPCGCFPSNSRVEYTTNVREYVEDIVREMGINVAPPLHYDCETGVISLNCHEMAVMPDCGCGDAG